MGKKSASQARCSTTSRVCGPYRNPLYVGVPSVSGFLDLSGNLIFLWVSLTSMKFYHRHGTRMTQRSYISISHEQQSHMP